MEVKNVIRDTVVSAALRGMKKGKLNVERSLKDIIIYGADSAFTYTKIKGWLNKNLNVQYADEVLASMASKTLMNSAYNIILDGMLSGGAKDAKEGDVKGPKGLSVGRIAMHQGSVALVSTLVKELFLV